MPCTLTWPPARRPSALFLAVLGLTLAGCSSTPLSLRDNNAPSALLRATLRPAAEAGGGGLELEAQRVRGQARQTLLAPDSVRVGGRTIDGPATLQHDATAQHLHLVYHHRLFAGRPLEMAWFVGGAGGRLDWSTVDGRSATGSPLRQRVSWYGPTGGVSGRANLGAGLFVEARYAGAIVTSDLERGRREMGELALGWQVRPALQLRLGVAESQLSLQPGDSITEMQLRARGPFAALVLGF